MEDTMKYQIAVLSSGVDLGQYDGQTEDEAVDAMAVDAGYKNYRDMCSITEPENLDAEVDRQRRDLIVTAVE
jgi:hypothetical protein